MIKQSVFYCLILLFVFQQACQPRKDSEEGGAALVTFHSNFEGGSLGEVEEIAPLHYACAVEGESDWEERNRQASWYYFMVKGAKGKALTIDLTQLVGEYNYKYGAHAITEHTRPLISYDQEVWQHLDDRVVSWDDAQKELRLQIKPKADSIWIAHQPPYTNQRLKSLLSEYQDHSQLSISNIGESVEGRDLQLLTITDTDVPQDKKKVIWLMARQHSWEAGTSWVMEGALRYLLDSAEEHQLGRAYVFKIMPMADPDGVARGGVRFNSHGHDLNRNWDLVKPDEMPEIYAQKTEIVNWLLSGKSIDLFLTLHNTEAADYIQGPQVETGQKLWQYMVDHSSFKADEGIRKMPESTTAGKRGRMTVNQALWAEQKVAAYLMELKVEEVEKIGRRRNVEDWLTLGPKILQAMVSATE